MHLAFDEAASPAADLRQDPLGVVAQLQRFRIDDLDFPFEPDRRALGVAKSNGHAITACIWL